VNKLAAQGDQRITLREFSKITGVSYRTAAAYAQKAGWTRNGKPTLLTEEQVTVLVEAIKSPISSGTKANLASQTQGIDTAKSRALRINLLHRRIEAEMQAEINELDAELSTTRQLLEYRTAGLETIQRIAEAGGLINTDRDDLNAMYRRR
jgi:ribosomal protein S13